MSPEFALDLRECVRAVRERWTTVQADALANRKAHQALALSLRGLFTEEET